MFGQVAPQAGPSAAGMQAPRCRGSWVCAGTRGPSDARASVWCPAPVLPPRSSGSVSFRDTSAFHVSNLGHGDWSEPRPLQIGQRCPTQIEPRCCAC